MSVINTPRRCRLLATHEAGHAVAAAAVGWQIHCVLPAECHYSTPVDASVDDRICVHLAGLVAEQIASPRICWDRLIEFEQARSRPGSDLAKIEALGGFTEEHVARTRDMLTTRWVEVERIRDAVVIDGYWLPTDLPAPAA